MAEKIKILIITAPYGNGHLAVASDLINELNKLHDVDYSLYDLFTEDYPHTTRFIQNFYLKTYKKGLQQQIYRLFYYCAEKILNLKIAKPYRRFGFRKLLKKIAEINPNLILNTFPVNSTYVLRDEGINIPIYSIITDYFANYNWISNHIRIHFLASNYVINQLEMYGINDKHYFVSGIPVKPIFYEDYCQDEINRLKKQYHIDKNKKVILIVAGAHGVVPNMHKIIPFLLREKNTQLLVICGKNMQLFKQLKRKFNHNQQIQLFQFVHNIHEFMRISDIMITKPGGITMTEAANIGLPVVLYRPVYGQELENAHYFQNQKAAVIANQEAELVEKVLTILKDEVTLKQMKTNIKNIATKYSASLIINHILEDYKVYLKHEN